MSLEFRLLYFTLSLIIKRHIHVLLAVVPQALDGGHVSLSSYAVPKTNIVQLSCLFLTYIFFHFYLVLKKRFIITETI